MVDVNLVRHAREIGLPKIQVLGACAVRGYVPDRVEAGTVLKVQVDNNNVWVIRDNGKKLGTFPPGDARKYMEIPESQRYSQVVIASDVNLNDKYGQCFVYPII